MKYLPFLSVVIISLCVHSCNTDNSSSQQESDASDPDNQDANDDENNNEGAISLVDAFPNLSFNQPLDFQVAPDGSNKIYIAEKGGKIKVFDNNSSISETQTFLDLGNISTTSEQGLLGFTFHPDFENNGHFYVCYTPNSGVSLISRFTISMADSNATDVNTELEILPIPQPESNHNGGQIAFGSDGYLYIAVGDGGGSGDPNGNAQNRSNLLGNILRIDVDHTEQGLNYSIPIDNPFIGESSIRNEIYAYGFRNPWRMSFDTETGKLWIGDVGQNKIEEIDVVELGGNYGWNLFEGTDCFTGSCDNANLIAPLFEYSQDNGDRSITGGYVYRGAENTTIQGKYIYGDFVSGRIWALSEDGSTNELLLESRLSIASFGTDANQELYVCAFDGKIYRFERN